MHELSVVQEIIRIVENKVVENEEDFQILNVHLQVGHDACVMEEALLFSFDLVKDGALKNSSLIIERIDGKDVQVSALEVL